MSIVLILIAGLIAVIFVVAIVLVIVFTTRNSNVVNKNNRLICSKCGCPSDEGEYCVQCGNKLK